MLNRVVGLVASLVAVLPLFAAITGNVMTSTGQPLAGARVSLRAFESDSARYARLISDKPEIEPLASTMTDAKGAFSLESPSDAVVALMVERSGHVPMLQWIERDEEVGALMLLDGEPDTGIVRAGGKPVANAVVSILYRGFEHVTRTDEQGRYEAPDLSRADRLAVVHPDFAIEEVVLAGTRGNASEANRMLVAGSAFSGRVVAADGRTPVAGAALRVDEWPVATSDESGAFTIAHMPPRWSILTATKGNEVALRMSDKQLRTTTLRLERAPVVSGRVTSAKSKTPLPGAMVRVFQSRPGSLTAPVSEMVMTDAKGNYSLPVVPGSWRVMAVHPAHAPNSLDVVLAQGRNETTDLALEALARISGQVVDEARQPIAAAIVHAENASGGFGPPRRPSSRAITGPDGRFTLRTRVEGKETQLFAKKRGLPNAKTDAFPLAAGDRRSGITISIASGYEVTGLVTDADGNPLSGVAVIPNEVEQGPRGMMMMARARADEDDAIRTASDGTFTLRVSEGTWDFGFTREGYAPKSVPAQKVSASESPALEVKLDPAVSITGRVVRDGVGIDGASVSAMAGMNSAAAVTAADGSFQIDGLAAGETRLLTRKPEEFINDMRTVTAPGNVIVEIQRGGGIRGRVVDKSTGSPVTTFQAGTARTMTVGGMARNMGSQTLDFTSDDGSFNLANVPSGATTLVVSAPGYAAARLNVTVEEGKVHDAGEVQLETGAILTGRVTGPSGSAVPNVTIRPVAGLMGGGGSASPMARTDERGEYKLEGLPSGDETILFAHDDYVSTRKRVNLEGREMRLDVQLGKGVRITGSIVTESGAPVAEAAVEAISSSGTFEAAKTNASGVFEIESAAPGRYRFAAHKSGYAQGTVEDFDVTSGAPLRIVLSAGGTIYGRVLGLSERELPRAEVQAYTGPRNNMTARVDAQGNYRLEGASIGTVEVSASIGGPNGYRSSSEKTVEVTAGGSHQVDLEFRGSAVVNGRVIRNGAPLPNAQVTFGGMTQGSAATRTDDRGAYTVSVDEGEYDVVVRDGPEGSYRTKYTVRGGGTFDIVYTTVTARGHVLDAATNEPLAGAAIQMRPAGASDERTTWFASRGARTDAAGTFVIGDLAAGAYTLTASRDGYGNATREVNVGSTPVEGLELKLMKNDGVVLKVVDGRDGRAIRGIAMVFDLQGRVVHDGRAMLGGSSEFELRLPLSPGTYSAFVFTSGYAGRNVTFQSPSTQSVALTPGGTLLIRSQHSEPRLVRLLDASGTPMWRYGMTPPSRQLLATPATTTLENVAAGTYTLQLLGPNETIADSKQVTVQEGRATTIDL